MDTFWNVYNITNILLIILSLSVIGGCIHHCMRGKKQRWFHYAGPATALVVIVLCLKAMHGNYRSYDLYNKLVRPTKSYYLDELRLSPKECIKDFEEIAGIVNDNYRALADYKKIDLDKLHEEYRKKVAEVENAQQYGLLLVRYFSALGNMHTCPYFSKYKNGLSLISRNDSIWVSKNHESLGLKRKDLIIAIDGVSTADYIRESMNFVYASTNDSRRKFAALQTMYSYTGTSQQFTIQRGDSVFDVEVPFYKQNQQVEKLKEQVKSKESLRTSSQKKNDSRPSMASLLKSIGVGYIEIPHFESGSVDNFRRQFDDASECNYMIIDVRDNPGGRQRYVMDIARYLIVKTTTIGKVTVESDTEKSYKGKIYVLMNGMSSSGAELLVAMLKERPDVVVIGECSAGDCGSMSYNYRTSHGIDFKIATQAPFLLSDGRTFNEGTGIEPDITAKEKLPWEEGKTVLGVVLELIKQEIQRNYEAE